jgi:DNA-binding transcriptional regulator GbsR (MarR family)
MAAPKHSNGQHEGDVVLFEAVAELGKLLGLNKSAALALAFLFAADGCASLDEISASSGIAKSSSSVILKNLEQMGLVEVVHQPHDRRRYYQVAGDPGDRVAMLIARRLKSLADHQQDICQIGNTDHSRQYTHRVEQLKGIYQGLLQAANFLQVQRAEAWKAFDERLSLDEITDAPSNSVTTRSQP